MGTSTFTKVERQKRAKLPLVSICTTAGVLGELSDPHIYFTLVWIMHFKVYSHSRHGKAFKLLFTSLRLTAYFLLFKAFESRGNGQFVEKQCQPRRGFSFIHTQCCSGLITKQSYIRLSILHFCIYANGYMVI